MGCGISEQKDVVNVSQTVSYKYTIIVIPPSFDNQVDFHYTCNYSSISLPTLMNFLAFDYHHSKEFDVNFISVRDNLDGVFKYYVQRLIGYEIEDEAHPKAGKMWVPYINNHKRDWSIICEEETRVTPADVIEWKFQKHTEVYLSPTKVT